MSGLYLNNNKLSGSIPTTLGQLPLSLNWLYLYSNQLNGMIPTELGQLTSLHGLYLYENQFSGCIPNQLKKLSTVYQFYDKYLEFCNISYGNNISSTQIPILQTNTTYDGDLINICDIVTSWNLYDNVTTCLNNVKYDYDYFISFDQQNYVTYLNLNRFNLYGTIPTLFGQLTRLKSLFLDNNQLYGSIPTELGDMKMIYQLSLYSNQINGAIPTELFQASNLQYLYFRQTELYSFPAF